MSVENGNRLEESQQAVNEARNNEQNGDTVEKKMYLLNILLAYLNCKSEKSRRRVRKKAIKKMKRFEDTTSIVELGNFAKKYASSAPYHVFFTRIEKSKETYDQQFSVTFPEILDRSLGEIVHSLHLNFMVDVGWLCLQYLLAGQCPNMMIIYGERLDQETYNITSNITTINIDMPEFSCHHTKIMILRYKDDGIRVVVSTANLYSNDWKNRTQGLWISPHLPPLPQTANSGDGESPTGFKMDFERYLKAYGRSELTQWIWVVRRADFSAVNVFLVASVPGIHKGFEAISWGHRKLAHVLSRYATLPPDAPQWPIVAQSSSVGNFGPNYKSWLLSNIVRSMSQEAMKSLTIFPKFIFIYPSIENYKQSFDRENLSCCLPYSVELHSKQKWIESYL